MGKRSVETGAYGQRLVRSRVGCRRHFQLRVLGTRGEYPAVSFRTADALYEASESLVYTIVHAEPHNDIGYSEVAWNEIGEIRLWGALALSIREGRGFYIFSPGAFRKSLYMSDARSQTGERCAKRAAQVILKSPYRLHWEKPTVGEITTLYHALRQADEVLLRGVNCFLKALVIWRTEDSWMLMEEMGINLYISLEAGLSVIRRRLQLQTGREDVSYREAYEFIAGKFTYGQALVDFWQECRDDRNILVHPTCELGPYAIAPMSADDIVELLDPMLSLYRYVLLGELRPTFEEITGRPENPVR